MKKVGIFSGTFDPIHEGHIMFAHTAMDHFGLDEVLLIPEDSPRTKSGVTDLAHRSEMIELALEDFSDIKLHKVTHPQHTLLETMEELLAEHGTENSYTLLMGADVFESIESWKDFSEIGHTLSYIVALRTEDDGEIVVPLADKLNLEVEFVPSPLSSVSSQTIRAAVKAGTQPRGLNDDVEKYINENSLYTN